LGTFKLVAGSRPGHLIPIDCGCLR